MSLRKITEKGVANSSSKLIQRKLSTLNPPVRGHGQEAERVAIRMKQLQDVYEMTLPAQQPYVLRLDGVAFRQYTQTMVKPFDGRFTRAMMLTTRDLLERCAARLAYCQSDEVSLLFAAEPSSCQIIYGGRVQKMASVMASLAAARFNHHIRLMDWKRDEGRETVSSIVPEDRACFDARVFSAPSEELAAEAIYWRHALDGRRNALNMVAHSHYPHEKLQNISLNEILSLLKKDGISPFTDYPPSAIYGVFMKKSQYPHVGFNPKTGVAVPTLRTRVEARSFDWAQVQPDEKQRVEMALSKFWIPLHPASLENIDLNLD